MISDQTGFLKGEILYWGKYKIINHTAARNIPGLIMFLDFEQAFDSVEWSFL